MIGRVTIVAAVLAAFASCGNGSATAPPPAPEIRAIERAEWSRDAEAEALTSGAAARSAEVRARAARAWGRIQDAGSWRRLVVLLDDPEPLVRREAAFALGQLGLASGARAEPAVVSALVAALTREDGGGEWRATVVQALGKQADPELQALYARSLLTGPDPRVRTESAHALLRHRFVPTWRGEADDPPAWDDDASAALIVALEDDNADVRAAAAHALSRYPWPAAVDGLAERREDPDPRVRTWAVRGVGRSGSAGDAGRIAWGLEDGDAAVRTEAVAAFARLERAADLPDRLVDDASFHVRAAFAAALADPAREVSESLWTRLGQDASPTVRAAALTSWTTRTGVAALPRLDALAASTAVRDRVAAAGAAGSLGADGRPLLVSLSADAHPVVASAALAALATLEDRLTEPAAVRALDRALADERLAVRGTAAGLLTRLPESERLSRIRTAWKSSDGGDWVEVREALVDAAGSLGPDAGVRAFLESAAASDPMPSVRARAVAALREFDPSFAPPETDPPADPPAAARFDPDTLERFGKPPRVEVRTDKGTFRFVTFPDAAPLHVSNLVTLVREGFYDGLTFHRVVSNFVVQGGDPTGTGWGGPGWSLPDEIHARPYARGTLGMPKAGKDTGGCQWFFTHLPTPHLDGNYTVFGEIVDGVDVVDRLEVGDRIVSARILP